MSRQLDVLFVNADSAAQAYQDLSKTYSAIEPPTWALLLAQSCRSKGFGVAILDCTAERITHAQAVKKIADANPRLVCFVVYGQNPNSGTTNMIGNSALCKLLKDNHPQIVTSFVGSHTSALPMEVLALSCVDIVLLNEGVYALHNLLQTDLKTGLDKVKGIGHKGNGAPQLNPPERVVPQERMDIDLPGYAWDLLPYDKKPLDLYRAHFWHAEFNHNLRTPFTAIYTSLGCKFKCDFCMINIVNRNDNQDGVVASNSPVMRFWSPDFIIKEFDKLAEMGVQTIRVSDEMFFLNKNYYEPLVKLLAERNHGFRMWTYSRVDTVREEYLPLFLKAGIQWLCLGIEAGNQTVRKEVYKGNFKDINIRDVVNSTRASGMKILSNFIFGLPEDNLETMQQTLDLALELNTEHANFYPAQALPGSQLYYTARANGWKTPEDYAGYAFLSYECEPLPTKYCTAAQVLKFRDEAWHKYFSNPAYLAQIERLFGAEQRKNVEALASIKLRRKLLGDAPPASAAKN